MHEKGLIYLAQETEALLEDIFLSGFHGLRKSTVQKTEALQQKYQELGMSAGAALCTQLYAQLTRYMDSFEENTAQLMQLCGQLEFYAEHLKSCLPNRI